MIRGMEPMMSEERLRELGSLSLKKKIQRKDLTVVFNYLPERYRRGRARYFSEVYGGRMQGNRQVGTQEMPCRYKENLSHHEDGQSDQTVEQAA